MVAADIVCTLRRPKILGMAVFDWVGSLLFAFVIGHFLLRLSNIFSWIAWIIWWILLGVFVHHFFGVHTMLGYYLGLNPPPRRTECPSKL